MSILPSSANSVYRTAIVTRRMLCPAVSDLDAIEDMDAAVVADGGRDSALRLPSMVV
jgi:hypothetical protein